MFKMRMLAVMTMASGVLCAQQKVRVCDAIDGQAIPYADLYFPDWKTSAACNANGCFTVNREVPSLLVQASGIGYKTWLGTIVLASDSVIRLEPAHFDMQEVVVAGESSKLQGENVLNVAKMALNDNPQLQGLSLAQQLSSVAGVNVLTTGTGIGKPMIRGLSGNRIAVFSQGVRIENQQWGDEHGLGLDENGYEQVEIIKGPASLLYGSDALGGVLYFADERFARTGSLEGELREAYSSNTGGWRSTAALKMSGNRLHWNLFGGYTTHGDYHDGAGTRVNNSRFRTGDIKTTLGYTGRAFTSTLKYGYLNEQYGLTEGDEPSVARGGAHTPGFPYQPLTTHFLSSENTFFFANQAKLKATIGYLFNNRKEFEAPEDEGQAPSSPTNEPSAALNMSLKTLSYSLKWYSPVWKGRWSLTVGSQGMYQSNVNSGQEMLIPDATTVDAGIFAMTDFHYTPQSYLQLGVRVDSRNIKGKEHGSEGEEGYFERYNKTFAVPNFSFGIFQKLGKNFSFRAALSSGFRAPNMFELLSDGVHEGTNRYEVGNTSLSTENNYQADAEFRYSGEHLEFFINPYLNHIRRFIFLEPIGGETDGFPRYRYTQTNAQLYGGETGFHLHPHPWDWLHLEGSYSSTFGRTTDGEHLPLMPAQQLKGTVRVGFAANRIIEHVAVFLEDRYVFAQDRVAAYEAPTPHYNLLSAGLSLDLCFGHQRILLRALVGNLTGERYYDHLSRYKQDGILNMGRNLTLSIAVPIGKVNSSGRFKFDKFKK